MVARSVSFGDLLDPRFRKAFNDEKNQLPDFLSELFSFDPTNNRADMRWTQVSGYSDFDEFSGTVAYQDATQGYDTTGTPLEFAKGIKVERKLFDDDQYNIMNARPVGLARSAVRTRQVHGARILNNATSVDTFFYNNSEGVALGSNSHTTTVDGVSTGTGFDNLTTSALSATALSAARIQMVGFKDAAGNKFSVMPDEIWIPNDLYEKAFEIVASLGKVDVANNNRNIHEGAYTIKEWNYLTDTNNWFLTDSAERRAHVHWIDRIPLEFAFAEDLDTLVAKWRAYGRWGNAVDDWRWILVAGVS